MSDVEPWYLAEIRDALHRIKYPVPSPPSRSYYDPLHQREKLKEALPAPASFQSAVIDRIDLYCSVTEAKSGKSKIYGGGFTIMLDHSPSLEASSRGTAESIDHWQIKWASIAIGQLWRVLRCWGIRDPRTREARLIAGPLAAKWLSPGQSVKRARMSVRARRDWIEAKDEFAKWTGLRWIENLDIDLVERRANKLATRAVGGV